MAAHQSPASVEKRLKGRLGIQGLIQFRLMLEGYIACAVTEPVPAPRRHRFGRNWTVDISDAASSEEFDTALRIVREIGAEFDCRDFRPCPRSRSASGF